MLSLLDVRQVPINARFGTLAQKGLKVKLIFIRTEKNPFVSRDCIGRLQWGSQIFFRNSAAEGTCGGPEVGCRVLSWHTPATLATVHQTVDECCQIQGPANCRLEE